MHLGASAWPDDQDADRYRPAERGSQDPAVLCLLPAVHGAGPTRLCPDQAGEVQEDQGLVQHQRGHRRGHDDPEEESLGQQYQLPFKL